MSNQKEEIKPANCCQGKTRAELDAEVVQLRKDVAEEMKIWRGSRPRQEELQRQVDELKKENEKIFKEAQTFMADWNKEQSELSRQLKEAKEEIEALKDFRASDNTLIAYQNDKLELSTKIGNHLQSEISIYESKLKAAEEMAKAIKWTLDSVDIDRDMPHPLTASELNLRNAFQSWELAIGEAGGKA